MRSEKAVLSVLVLTGVVGFAFVLAVLHGIGQDIRPNLLLNDTDQPVTYRLLMLRSGEPHVVILHSAVLAPGKLANLSEAHCVFIEDGKGNVTSSILREDVPFRLMFVPVRDKLYASEKYLGCDYEKSDAVCQQSGKEIPTKAETCP